MYNPYIIYDEIYIPDFISQQYIKTNMQICFIKKVSISYSHNSLVKSPSEISVPYTAITYITGQRPVIALAKKSISSWKLRKKALIGCKVTLRRQSAFLYLLKLYTYGFFIPLVENKNYFLKKTSFGCKNPLKKDYFFELQKCGLRWRNFEGFSITLSL